MTSSSPRAGQRVEVHWHQGETDVWYRGAMLEGGGVAIDDPTFFVFDGPSVLEPGEIAEPRLA